MSEAPARRFTLLYQLYLTSQASRQFMKLALAEADLNGEEYALCSYLYGNGPRTLTQTARDLGLPITTVATLFAPLIEAGDVARSAHPTDGRARLLALSEAGSERLERAIPAFTTAYRSLLEQLRVAGVDSDQLFNALAELRTGIDATNRLLAVEAPRT